MNAQAPHLVPGEAGSMSQPNRVLSYPFSITAIPITPDGRTAAAAANTAVIPIDLQARKAGQPIRVPAGSAIGLLP